MRPEFSRLALSLDECSWLEKTCPYLKRDYLDYLKNYRFRPEQVVITFDPLPGDPNRGHIGIAADGLWVETIMWEVPLMACLSELYFTVVNTDWDYDGQLGVSPVQLRLLDIINVCSGGIYKGKDLGGIGLHHQRVWNQTQKILQDPGSCSR